MKNIFKPLLFTLSLAFLVTACDGEYNSLVGSQEANNPIPSPPPPATGDPGNADFSKVVTIGNSLTAGFKDGALYDFAQSKSLGAQLNKQLTFAGAPETFNQPDINSAVGFTSSDQGVILGRFKLDTSIPGPSPVINGELPTQFTGDKAALNNFGVPGIQVGQLLTPDTGNPNSPAFNPFYARFASQPGASTILGDAIAANPTFFSLWIGNNDVLGYALSGGTNAAILTSPGDFQARFSATVGQLMANTQAKGIVADIPALLFAPYFRAVAWNVINFSEADAGTVAQLNGAFAGFNQALDAIVANMGHPAADAARRKVSYKVGSNPVLIRDSDLEDLSPKFDMLLAAGAITPEQRQALQPYVQARPMAVSQQTGPEIVLLAAGAVIGRPADPNNPLSLQGIVVPLAEQFHLTSNKIITIETARQTFNAIIQNVVNGANSGQTRLALYQTNSMSSAFADIWGLDGSGFGIRVGTVTLAPDFSPNGVFSTDGIHPNSRGVALVVNDMLDVIENTFGSDIPRINVLGLPGIQVCAGDCVSQQSATLLNMDFSHIPLN
jgi:hypothetical protein